MRGAGTPLAYLATMTPVTGSYSAGAGSASAAFAGLGFAGLVGFAGLLALSASSLEMNRAFLAIATCPPCASS